MPLKGWNGTMDNLNIQGYVTGSEPLHREGEGPSSLKGTYLSSATRKVTDV